jgi:hypothetical protein
MNPMPRLRGDIYKRLVRLGLRDPFIQVIAGLVVVALVASYALLALGGNGLKAIVAVGLTVTGGVVLVILRTLMKYSNTAFVKAICFLSSSVIIVVFLVFVVLLIPAATICWPQPYAELLGLPICHIVENVEKFEPNVPPYAERAVTYNLDYAKYYILVFYRPERRKEAEYIVGVLKMAGFRSEGILSNLEEVYAPDRGPGASNIKTCTRTRPIIEEVAKFVRLAIPVNAQRVSVSPEDVSFQRGSDVQISLF